MHEYLNIKEAATYCCYHYAYFGRIMDCYQVPKYGPKKNRLKISDLDAWMKNPQIFKSTPENARLGFRKVQ